MKIKIIAILLIASTMQCAQQWASLKVASLNAPADKASVGTARVTGEECKWWGFNRTPTVEEAVADALSKAPGATAMKDVKVTYTRNGFFSTHCFIVDGIPVK